MGLLACILWFANDNQLQVLNTLKIYPQLLPLTFNCYGISTVHFISCYFVFLFLENHEVRNIGFNTMIQEIIGLIAVSTSPGIHAK